MIILSSDLSTTSILRLPEFMLWPYVAIISLIPYTLDNSILLGISKKSFSSADNANASPVVSPNFNLPLCGTFTTPQIMTIKYDININIKVIFFVIFFFILNYILLIYSFLILYP